MSEKVDAIVVGAGIGGSIVGAYLAKGGLKTVVFEKAANVGGYKYGSYKLGEITTDNHCHVPMLYFSLNGGNGWWAKAAAEVGAPLQWQALPNPHFYFRGNLVRMPFCTSGEAFVDFITGMMPLPDDAKKGLAKVFDDAINMPEEVLWSREMTEMPFQKWLAERTDNELVKQLFNVLNDISIVGATMEASVTCTMSVMIAFLAGWLNLTYMANGTAEELPKSFGRVVTKHGGQILLEHTVEKVIIENGRAKGVVVKDREGKEKTYEAKYVIVNASYDILDKILGLGNAMPKEITEACQSMNRANEVALDVHFALKKRIAHPTGSQIVVIDDNMQFQGSILYPDVWVPSLAPAGKQLIQTEKFMTRAEFETRTIDEWKTFMRDLVETVFPGFKDEIEFEQAHVKYAPAGYYIFYYGPKVPVECPGIPNLFFTGDYTQAGGFCTDRAAASAMVATKKILGTI